MASSNAFFAAMDARRRGENGAPELTATGVAEPLVALFFKLVRSVPDAELASLFRAASDAAGSSATAQADLVVLAFQTRATRGVGKGEKAIFYKLLGHLDEAAVLATLHLVPHYGYFKDYLLMQEMPLSTPVKQKALELMVSQLSTDAAELAEAERDARLPKLSLAAKYAPREGTHFDKGGLGLAKALARRLFGANDHQARRKYRQMLSKLNAALNTTEVLMAANRFAEIEFARVASVCLQRCRKAFLNETLKGRLTLAQEETGNRHPDDPQRVAARQALRAAVAKKSVKGKQLFPHEIAAKCMRQPLNTLEGELMQAQWAAVREGTREAMADAAAAREEAVRTAAREDAGLAELSALRAALPRAVDLGKLVALVDVSGSMSGQPMEAAIGLGLLVSELAAPAFRDRVLTFESRPQWVDLSGFSKVEDKVKHLQRAPWGGSTDFEAACELILQTAERAKLKPDDVPDLIVFSDMQFDCARGSSYYGSRGVASWETHHERLVRRFAEVGRKVCSEPYAAPRVIYWNLRGDTAGFPVQADAPNTQMLSGFSQALLKLLLSGKDLVGDEKEVVLPDGTTKVVREGPTPVETVRQALDDTAFDPVRLALAGVSEGAVASYSFEKDDFELVVAEGA